MNKCTRKDDMVSCLISDQTVEWTLEVLLDKTGRMKGASS